MLFGQDNKILFIENKGQWGDSVLYGIDIPEGKLLLKKNGLSYVLTDIDPETETHHTHTHSHALRSGERLKLDVNFVKSKTSKVVPSGERKERYNYYFGKNQNRWAEGCRAFEEVSYQNVYKGIDLKIYQLNGSIKYDWIIAPRSNPSEIKMQYKGDIQVFLEDGCTFIGFKSATIMEDRPVAYQLNKRGEKTSMECQYKLQGKELSFEIEDSYASNQTLIIDPELVFSTFSGSVSDNFGYTACFDDAGNLYSGGIVFGGSFPTTTGNTFGGGASDIAILKYDSSGQNLLYATFIGGNSGESPHSMVVNNRNELVILGTSGSVDFPISTLGYDNTYNGGRSFSLFEEYTQGTDIVVTKLDENGRLIASTFIGGPGNDGILRMNQINDYVNTLIYNYGDYQRGDIIVDINDNVYVAASTDSTGFPISGNIQTDYSGGNSDAVVFSLNSDLSSLRWSTYLGGSADDAAYSIKLLDDGQVVVGGGTNSSNFPTSDGALLKNYQGNIDGFISTIDARNDSISESTYMGTSQYDQIYFIDIDSDQNIYATGQTRGSYPVTAGAYSNPNSAQFIHKLTTDLDSTLFSTVFGSGTRIPNISPTAFLANECGNIFLSGWGGEVNQRNSPSAVGTTLNLPVTPDAINSSTDGSDFYMIVLSADGRELLYGTYYGSTNNGGDHVDGGTSRFDKKGIVYQATCSCGGSDDDFPTTENAWSTVNRGVNAGGIERCNNAAFKFDLATLKARFETSDENSENIGLRNGCAPLTILFNNTSTGGEEVFWDFGNGETSTEETDVLITYEEGGTYPVTLTVRDANTCTVEDVFTSTVQIFEDEVSISNDLTICEGSSATLTAGGGVSYRWTPATSLNDATIANPIASPTGRTTYEVTITTPNGCIETENVIVSIERTIFEDFDVLETQGCSGFSNFQFINNTIYQGDILWHFGDGSSSSERDATHIYNQEGTYVVSLEINERCVNERSIQVDARETFIPNVFTPNNDGFNDFFEIKSPSTFQLTVINRNGSTVYKSESYNNDWDGGDLPSGVYYYAVEFATGLSCNGWVQIIR